MNKLLKAGLLLFLTAVSEIPPCLTLYLPHFDLLLVMEPVNIVLFRKR